MSFNDALTAPPYKVQASEPQESGLRDPETSMIKKTQDQVEEAKQIMVKNVESMIERERKLYDLENKAEELSEKSSLFQKATKKLKEKYWWEAHKWKIIIGGVVLLLFIMVTGALLFMFL